MKNIRVKKTDFLKGNIKIQGSKNTVLPIIASTLLSSGVSIIYNCPEIEDVKVMCQLLECFGAKIQFRNHTLTIDTEDVEYAVLPQELTTRLRSSVLLLGPILAKWKKVEMGIPGGCAIGLRPIDIHLQGFLCMNARVSVKDDVLLGQTQLLKGNDIYMRFPSVGATENLLLAAVVADGKTVLHGAAKEPEIIELCKYLNSIGARIEGVGTDTLIVNGVRSLGCGTYYNVYDRIVAGTYILATVAVPSDITLEGIDDISYIKNIVNVAVELGINVVKCNHCLRIQSVGQCCGGLFHTGVYPEFPTDLLPVLITVLLKAKSGSCIEETIFENRLGIINELEKIGAEFTIDDRKVYIKEGMHLHGEVVNATDLRQGAALVIAGLLGEDCTTVKNIFYIERGYEDIVRDLKNIQAQIEYV